MEKITCKWMNVLRHPLLVVFTSLPIAVSIISHGHEHPPEKELKVLKGVLREKHKVKKGI